VELSILHKVGESLTRVPEDFEVHRDIQKLLASRKRALESGKGITMAFAESLSFGCLMTKFSPDARPGLRALSKEERTLKNALGKESPSSLLDVAMKEHPTVHVRLSGQDCVRGTFNQRHAAIICQRSGRSYWQLNNMSVDEQGTITVCNSSLSEAAILGFEYGYRYANVSPLL
jgi:2-oxoglutarate dehydrogenase E1 component